MDRFFDFYLWEMYQILDWLLEVIQNFLSTFFDSEDSWLFDLAFLPFILMFVVDILFSFIFSVRYREIKFFNVLSPKSWRLLNESRRVSTFTLGIGDGKNHLRDFVFKKFFLTPFAMKLRYKKAKAGDNIYTVDGNKYIYSGVRMSADRVLLYKYVNNRGIYFSTLNPYRWANSNGSQRMESSVYKKNFKT